MGFFNWMTHRQLRAEANRLAKDMLPNYDRAKKEYPDLDGPELIKRIFIAPEKLEALSPEGAKYIDGICQSINGLCYMTALDTRDAIFGKHMNIRQLQFTKYMDIALEEVGFPKQTREQKLRVLNTLGLDIDGWERIG